MYNCHIVISCTVWYCFGIWKREMHNVRYRSLILFILIVLFPFFLLFRDHQAIEVRQAQWDQRYNKIRASYFFLKGGRFFLGGGGRRRLTWLHRTWLQCSTHHIGFFFLRISKKIAHLSCTLCYSGKQSDTHVLVLATNWRIPFCGRSFLCFNSGNQRWPWPTRKTRPTRPDGMIFVVLKIIRNFFLWLLSTRSVHVRPV